MGTKFNIIGIVLAVLFGVTCILALLIDTNNTPNYKEQEIRSYTYWIYIPQTKVNIFTNSLVYDQYGNLILTNYINTEENNYRLVYRGSEWQLLSQGTYLIRQQK